MIKKSLLRLSSAVFAVFGSSVLSFVLLRLAPGDPVGLVLGPFATEAAKLQLAAEMGLNKSILVQYGLYLQDLFRGNWGYSYSMGQPIYELFASRLPASLELSIAALFFTFTTALLLALVKTYTKRRGIKTGIDLFCYAGYSMPQFFLGLMALVIFSGVLFVFPGPEGRTRFPSFSLPHISGFLVIDSIITGNLPLFLDAVWHLILPAFTLGLYSTAFLTRILQANLEQAYNEKFIAAGLSRGISEWYALIRHALPNALVISATAAAVLTGILITGTMLVETVFAWPGIGALITLCIQKKDFSVVQAFIFFSAFVFILSNLAVEILINRIDPRLHGTSDILK